MLLKDKVVIITGVGPGMGRKLALVAAEEGDLETWKESMDVPASARCA